MANVTNSYLPPSSHLDWFTLFIGVAHPLAPVKLDHVGAFVAQEVDKQLLLDLWETHLHEIKEIYTYKLNKNKVNNIVQVLFID